MADTSKIKSEVEPYVQSWLSVKFPGHSFKEQSVKLPTGHTYAFDAVSEDSSIVGCILCNRPKTRTGRENTGGIHKALAELHYIAALPPGVKRLMIFTDEGFLQLAQRRATRIGVASIDWMFCQLPPHLEGLLKETLDKASQEQRAAE